MTTRPRQHPLDRSAIFVGNDEQKSVGGSIEAQAASAIRCNRFSAAGAF
jgi:hypothetical protein